MDKKNFLVLHKSEWDRLNRPKSYFEEDKSDPRDEYFKQLVEKSQNWIRKWPDSVQGHVEKVAKNIEKKRKENKNFFKSFSKKKKEENLAEIKRAKQFIFEDSCYGRQLLSALYESKNLEEREIQLQFQAKLQQEAKNREGEDLSTEPFYTRFEEQNDAMERKKRQLSKEVANINQCMYKMKIYDDAKLKSEREKEEQENAQLTIKLLENELQQEIDYKENVRRDIREYEEQQKQFRTDKAKREKLEEAKLNTQRIEQEKRYCQIKHVMDELHQDKRNTQKSHILYELIKEIQDTEKTRYDKFLEAGIKREEAKFSQKEQEELLNDKLKREKCYAIAQENKETAEDAQKCPCRIAHKCVCDRQTIILKSKGNTKTAEAQDKNTHTSIDNFKELKEKSPTSFMRPTNKLLEELKQREKEPSPWNGLRSTHATFAEQAGNTLKECRHKIFARKVVDEYRKTNLLDATTLPVDNYY